MRRRLGFLLAAVLGAAVVVLPAIATSETGPTITAENLGGIYGETHVWTPPQVTITQGGPVTLRNPTEVKHGVEWVGPPAPPTCDSGVPVGNTEAASNTKWSGTCTFTTPGIYVFYCTVHHAAMTGRVTVAANGTTTITTQPPPTSPGGAGMTPPITTPEPSPFESPLAGTGSTALKVASKQHGKSVRGSVAVSPAGAGGRLEVDLLAKRASLASVGHQVPVRVGKLVQTALSAGAVSFSVPLSARAKAALHRRRRLPLNVKVIIKPASGSAVTVTRAVVLRP